MIYLDNSATTRPFDAVIESMAGLMRERYYNASAAYGPALAVEKEIRVCRRRIAESLGAQEAGVVFTSCGTESDNLAILGTAAQLRRPGRFFYSAAEHPAVAETMKRVVAMGHETVVLPLDARGIVDLAAAAELIRGEVAMVCCMQVSNETGAIQPLAALSRMAKTANPHALMFSDGVQGYLRVPMRLAEAGVDLYTLSGHKIHGPKGVGALAMRPGIRLASQMTGGGQENGLRSGTYNSPAIAGLGSAVEAMTAAPQAERLRGLKLRLWRQLQGTDGIRCNGPDPADAALSAPHILSLSFDGVRGEVMRNALEGEGILVSTGSACSSHKQKVSPTLLSMGLTRSQADGTVRVSFGALNTEQEMDAAAEAMRRQYLALRAFQRR